MRIPHVHLAVLQVIFTVGIAHNQRLKLRNRSLAKSRRLPPVRTRRHAGTVVMRSNSSNIRTPSSGHWGRDCSLGSETRPRLQFPN